MKKIIIWIALTLSLVGLIGGATVVYNNYMEENETGVVAGIGGLFEQGTRPENEGNAPAIDGEEASDIYIEDTGDGESLQGEEETSGDAFHDSEALTNDEIASNVESGSNSEIGTDIESDETEESVSESETETVTETESESETETEKPKDDEPYYPAPDFTVYTADGEAVKLSDFRGKTVVINFWAKDCRYCVQEMPDFQKAYEKYGDDVVFMMIGCPDFFGSSVAKEQAYINNSGYTFPVYYDVNREAVTKYGVQGIPNTYFVEGDGGIYKYYIPGATTYATLEECILGAMGK